MALRLESKKRVDRILVNYSDLTDGVTVNYEPTLPANSIVTSVVYDVIDEFWEIPSLGSELVTNGGFSSTSSWGFGGDWNWSSLYTSAYIDGASSNLTQNISVTAGATYLVSFGVATVPFGSAANITVTLAGATSAVIPVSTQGVTHSVYLTAVNSGGVNGLSINGVLTSGPQLHIEDVSVREVTGYEGTGTLSIGIEDQDDDIFSDNMDGVSFEEGRRQMSTTGMVGGGAALPFSIKTTAARQLAVRYDAVDASSLSGGKMYIFIEWVLSDD